MSHAVATQTSESFARVIASTEWRLACDFDCKRWLTKARLPSRGIAVASTSDLCVIRRHTARGASRARLAKPATHNVNDAQKCGPFTGAQGSHAVRDASLRPIVRSCCMLYCAVCRVSLPFHLRCFGQDGKRNPLVVLFSSGRPPMLTKQGVRMTDILRSARELHRTKGIFSPGVRRASGGAPMRGDPAMIPTNTADL
jgi:hypothetical protein